MGGPVCTFGAGPVQTSTGLKFHVLATEEEERGTPAQEAAAWAGYAEYGKRVAGDSVPVWSLSGTGTNDGVILRNGDVFSATVAFDSNGNVIPGSKQALLAAIDALYNSTG